MKVIYIAGKVRASNHWEQEQNIRRAEALALDTWLAGFAALCPHCNTRNFQGAGPDGLWLQGDIEMMKRCDAVLTVENWVDSEGAKIEVEVAHTNNIPVFHSLEELKNWRVNGGLH